VLHTTVVSRASSQGRRRGLRSRHLWAALLSLAVLGVAAPAWAAIPAAGHLVSKRHHIVVSKSGINHTYSCGDGDTVVVHGNGDRLMFTHTCSTLTVTGTGDSLVLNRVSSITLTSATKDDTVCWDHGAPAVHDHGKQNITVKCPTLSAGYR
jgi:hypothetical protein